MNPVRIILDGLAMAAYFTFSPQRQRFITLG